MLMQQGGVRSRISEFAGGEVCFRLGRVEVVEGVGVDFGDAGAHVGADEVFEAFEFGLEDDEAEGGPGVGVVALVFDEFDLCERVTRLGLRRWYH